MWAQQEKFTILTVTQWDVPWFDWGRQDGVPNRPGQYTTCKKAWFGGRLRACWKCVSVWIQKQRQFHPTRCATLVRYYCAEDWRDQGAAMCDLGSHCLHLYYNCPMRDSGAQWQPSCSLLHSSSSHTFVFEGNELMLARTLTFGWFVMPPHS